MPTRPLLESVAWLHEAGFAHGSIGANSVVIDSNRLDKTPLEDVSSSVRVRLSELGYARPLLAPGALQRGDAARARQFGVDAADPRARAAFVTAEDLSACGFVLAQLLLGALGDEPADGDAAPPPAREEAALQRVYEDTCLRDFARFRAVCKMEPRWRSATALLDREDGAGWALLEALLGARQRAAEVTPLLAERQLSLDRTAAPSGGGAGDGSMLTARALLSNRLFSITRF